MKRKLQVFISSTYTDLIYERQAIVEAVLNAGHIPAGMEIFKAGRTQEHVIKKWIEQSDVYVLLLGSRYGSMKGEEGISYTEWEYNLAKDLGKPMFSLVLTEDYMRKQIDEKRVDSLEVDFKKIEYINFKKRVMNRLVSPINHIAEIRSSISDSINEIIDEQSEKLVGWIHGGYASELLELRTKNKELNSELIARQSEYIDIQKELADVKDYYIGEYSFDLIVTDFKNRTIPENEIKKRISSLEKSLNTTTQNDTRDQKLLKRLLDFEEILDKNSVYEVLLRYVKNIRNNGFKVSSEETPFNFSKVYLCIAFKSYYLFEGSNNTGRITEQGYKFLNILLLDLEKQSE